MFASLISTSLRPENRVSESITPWDRLANITFKPNPPNLSFMSTTVGDYLFSKLAEVGIRRVLGCGRASMFLGSVQRNYLRYDDLNHSVPSPERTDIGAFVVSRPEELSYCYDQRSFYFPYGPIVYVVEHSSAQFNNTSQAASQHDFAVAVIINSPTTAASQIRRALDTMLYESKPVYIGLSLAVAGQLISVPSLSPPSTSGPPSLAYSTPYSRTSPPNISPLAISPAARSTSSAPEISTEDDANSAKAAIAMAFIR